MDSSNLNNYNGIDNETLVTFRDQGLFTDIKFLVSGKELRAHKIVLASRSDVFRTMFSSGMAESQNHVTIKIDDIDAEVFSTFLNYMYTYDELLVQSRHLELLLCADKYNVHSLLSACDRFFAATVSNDNIFDYLDISETFNRQQIKDSAVEFLRNNIIMMVHDVESWSRLHNRFDTLTQLIGSYSRFTDFKEYTLRPDLWAERNVNDGSCVLNGNLSLVADSKNYSFMIQVDHDARGECLFGFIHLVEEYVSSFKVYVWLEIESDNQPLLRDKLLIRWSKMCSVDTSMDIECWRFVNDNPLPVMSTGPIIFTLPNASIFDRTMNIKIALSSLRPQSISDSSIEFITPSEMQLSEIRNLISGSSRGFLSDFGLKKNFDFQWSGFRPALTVENAPSTLCRITEADAVHQDAKQTENLKHKVLQFMKFHAAEVIKCKDWTTLQSRPDLLRDLLIAMAQ